MVEACISSISNWMKYIRNKMHEKLKFTFGSESLRAADDWMLGERFQEVTVCLLCSEIVSLVSACGSCSWFLPWDWVPVHLLYKLSFLPRRTKEKETMGKPKDWEWQMRREKGRGHVSYRGKVKTGRESEIPGRGLPVMTIIPCR